MTLKNEIWKPIKDYEGLYEISNYANIRSIANRWGKRTTPRVVKPRLTPKKYMRVTLSKKKQKEKFYGSRISLWSI